MSQVLELRKVVKRYPGHVAVDGVSLSVERGKLYSLLGPSGCGKTTTLRVVGGFETADAGEVWLDGQRVNHVPPHQRNVSTVFQNYALFPHLTALGNVEFGLKARRTPNATALAREALERVQLGGRADRRPVQLSGGERQRVALARSLVLEPQLLLLDEPLAALDPNLRRQMRTELKSLQRATGITFLFITHDREEALSMSDQVAVMNRGRIEQLGSPQELYRRPTTRFVAEFLGTVNWFGPVGVRPENTLLGRQRPGDGARQGTVTSLLYLGSSLQVQARLEDGAHVVSDLPANTELAEGESVWLHWDASDEMRVG
jgi:ABC-type Fe3+/spermidine/putrescine transport system ATPase subunit